MTETLHHGVAKFARETYPQHVERDGYYKYYDFENAIEISRDGNSQWAYRQGARDAWQLIATSNCLLGVELVMLLDVGGLWRTQEGKTLLTQGTHPRPDVTLEQHESLRWSVTWTGPSGLIVVSGLNRVTSDWLRSVAGHDLDELVASYRDPQGAPLFS